MNTRRSASPGHRSNGERPRPFGPEKGTPGAMGKRKGRSPGRPKAAAQLARLSLAVGTPGPPHELLARRAYWVEERCQLRFAEGAATDRPR